MEEYAARETERATLLDGDEAGATAIRHAFSRGGYEALLKMHMSALKEKDVHQYVAPLQLALAYAALAMKDETIRFIEEAYQERAPSLIWIQNEGAYDFLHADKRYRSIIRRMGLPPAY
jgi:hypothetical protein